MVQFLLLTPPPGNPRDKVSPCGRGVGNFASSLVLGVGGAVADTGGGSGVQTPPVRPN